MEKNHKILIALVGVLLIVGVAAWLFTTDRSGVDPTQEEEMQKPEGDPVDTVLDFYNPLVSSLKDPEKELSAFDLEEHVLSEEVRAQIQSAIAGGQEAVLSGIICQTTIPDRIRTRSVFELDDQAQFMVMSRDEGLVGQAIVTLVPHEGQWQISEIMCGTGEMAPQGEFSFDVSGFLLKDVPPPLDSQYWHLIFTQNGERGHFAPLHFDESSVCVDNGSESTCVPDQLREKAYVHVQGQMSEIGVNVVRVEYVE